MITCKFRCKEVRRTEGAETVVMEPVVSADKKDPNYTWYLFNITAVQ